jgi:lysophospholipase L1-like esterase
VTARIGAVFGALQRTQQEHRRLQFGATGAHPDRVVFLGDSISEFGLWSEWFPDVPVLNRGIGGETSAQVLARLDTAIDSPRAVVLLVGTNDLTAGVPEDDIVANIRAILDGIEQRAPGTPVLLQSVMPRTADFASEVRALNERCRRLSESASTVRYVDLWPLLAADDGTLRPEYTLDRLHLNGEGYRAWVSALRPLLTALPEAGPASRTEKQDGKGLPG